MFSFTNVPSTSSVFSTYTTVAASAMLIRTVINEFQNITTQLLPQKLQDIILAKLGVVFGNLSNSQTHLIIDEYNGFSINEIYQASELYLSTRITPSIQYLKVSKNPREKNISITINKDEKVVDIYQGIKLTWEFVSTEVKKSDYDYESYYQETETSQKKSITLSFQKGLTEKVLENYLPYVLERSKAITEGKKIVKLHSLGTFNGDYSGGPGGSVNFDHPSTFETLAMDPNLKKELVDDLDRFLKRKNFYKRVGKAWKRGYLLYGPPGTGKSSLIAAMANYLKFDIYDLELSSLRSNSELRSLLGSTANRSILVIEDIDCSVELQDRKSGGISQSESQLTLSGLLNFIDGLWTCCGDERIIVFTTNHKDKLDPALLRPGRMDMHIHMSYCTPSGFKILASNYLSIEDHHLFTNIEGLINEVEITPAEIAEELLKSENTDVALQGLIEFLRRKKDMKSYKEEFDEEKYKESKEDSQAIESEDFNKKVKKRGGKKNKTKTKAKRNQG